MRRIARGRARTGAGGGKHHRIAVWSRLKPGDGGQEDDGMVAGPNTAWHNPATGWPLIALAACLGSARLAADVPTSTVSPPPPANPPAKPAPPPPPANPPGNVPTGTVPLANPPAAQPKGPPANPPPATPPGDVPTTTVPPSPTNQPPATTNPPANPPANIPTSTLPYPHTSTPSSGPAPPPLPDTPDNRLAGYRSLTWDVKNQGGFVMSMCMDLHGCIWVGLEEDAPGDYGPTPPAGIVQTGGVWRYDPLQQEGWRWTHFTTKDGLGDDNAYAIACDHLGRIWVGHLNHGVSVYNGKEWRNYDVLTGPLGPRIFAIAVCPTDGDVWMASDAGLARYSDSPPATSHKPQATSHSSAPTSHKPQATNHFGCWSYYTRAEGLPSDQANAIAFDKAGNIFVGTQCDGIAMAKAAENYGKWTVVTGPDRMPNTPCGKGLPTNLINCLLVSRKTGTIYAGTTTGLAKSQDDGKTWSYVRGEDWKDKVLGLYQGPQPVDVAECPPLLPEDYVTALAEDAAGNLWIGTRQKGLEVVEAATGKDVARFRDDYVNAVAPVLGGGSVTGRYGAGAGSDDLPRAIAGTSAALLGRTARALESTAAQVDTPQPNAPEAVVPADVERVLRDARPGGAHREPVAAYDSDDWSTEGDWLGRYGRYWVSLCSFLYARDYFWGAGWEIIRWQASLGPHHRPGDSLRYHCTWLFSESPRVPEMPSPFVQEQVHQGLEGAVEANRRQCELDDHGEAYPLAYDGPGLRCEVTVPHGWWRLAFYEMNKDGHSAENRMRDYIVSVRLMPHYRSGPAANPTEAWSAPVRCRVCAFWGGVWKRFLVYGPCTVCVEVGRNSSFNTMLSAVSVDTLDENPPPYSGSPEGRLLAESRELDSLSDQISGGSRRPAGPAVDAAPTAALALRRLEACRLLDPDWWICHCRPMYLTLALWYRQQSKVGGRGSEPRSTDLATCYYRLAEFARWEGCQDRLGFETARSIEKLVRFDGPDAQGRGYEIVGEYARSHQASKGGAP